MNIDAALRYDQAVRVINKLKNKSSKILEVGSGTNGMTDFYDGLVVGLDSDFSKTEETKKNPNIIHKKGSILKIPFPKNSFDFVVCFDTFEHIKRETRIKAFLEMDRVCKVGGLVILGYPSGEKSEKAEEIIRNRFKRVQGYSHPWLLEHKKYGIPKLSEIEEYVQKNNLSFVSIKEISNVNIYTWILVHLVFTVSSGKKIWKVAKLIEGSIFKLVRILKFPPYYRRIYIIQK